MTRDDPAPPGDDADARSGGFGVGGPTPYDPLRGATPPSLDATIADSNAAPDHPSAQPGATIAERYRVERRLGSGGMGVVVAARDLRIGRTVAVKLLRPVSASEEARARMLREARATASLQSEHATRVFDVGELDSGEPFIVFELLAGNDLSAVLDERRAAGTRGLGIPDTVACVLQACDALAEAHALGIVHRDLKPSNLFLTRRPDGTACIKVLDFGISKVIRSVEGPATVLTRVGQFMGSPAYMSPEQVEAARDVDTRADIWSLGVILYELLCGTRPFPATSVTALVEAILADPPLPLRMRLDSIPVELEKVVSTCLEKDRDARFPTVGALATALAPFAPAEARDLVGRIVKRLYPETFESPVTRDGPSQGPSTESVAEPSTIEAATVETPPADERALIPEAPRVRARTLESPKDAVLPVRAEAPRVVVGSPALRSHERAIPAPQNAPPPAPARPAAAKRPRPVVWVAIGAALLLTTAIAVVIHVVGSDAPSKRPSRSLDDAPRASVSAPPVVAPSASGPPETRPLPPLPSVASWVTNLARESSMKCVGAAADEVDSYVGGVEAGPAMKMLGFVARIDELGQTRWTHRIEAGTSSHVAAVAIAEDGVYACGVCEGGLVIGEVERACEDRSFLMKLDRAGQVKWAKVLGAGASCTTLASDASERIAVAGVRETSTSTSEVFVAILDAHGDASMSLHIPIEGLGRVHSVAFTPSGRMAVAGAVYPEDLSRSIGLPLVIVVHPDRTYEHWDTSAEESGSLSSAAFDGAGTLVLSGAVHGEVRLRAETLGRPAGRFSFLAFERARDVRLEFLGASATFPVLGAAPSGDVFALYDEAGELKARWVHPQSPTVTLGRADKFLAGLSMTKNGDAVIAGTFDGALTAGGKTMTGEAHRSCFVARFHP